jgi:YbbR domain-containing protein
MKKNLHIILISFLFSIILWVSISLSNDYYTTVEVPVRIIDFPKGYSSGSSMPEKITIKVKGKGWKLIALNIGTIQNYVIPVGQQTGKRIINLYNYLAENSWLSSDLEVISISPDTVSFYIEKISSKKIPIIPFLNLKFRAGYGIASPVSIEPESTYVYGPVSFLNKLEFVTTESLGKNELDSRIETVVPLKSIPGMTYKDDAVTVNIDVQRIVEKSFDSLLVRVVDIPRDRNVVLLPNRVNISIRGGIDVLGKIDTSQFNAYVNFREVVMDTVGSIVPHLEIPENTSLIFIKPERLRYIIKKF